MNVKIYPSRAVGAVSAPPSKSMAHRALICGAFSSGSEIEGVSYSRDIEATISCLRGLSCDARINGDTVIIGGLDLIKNPREDSIYCHESGSTLRFLIPICLLFDREITIRGTKRLFERSLDIYSVMCREKGLKFELSEDSVTLCGPLTSGEYTVRGDVSSQFISGLMFALPNCSGDSVIKISGKLESASYIALTVSALREFGVIIEEMEDNSFYIRGNQHFEARNTVVEGDYSNAAFFEALNFIGGEVEVRGLSENSRQGDRVYKALFERIRKSDFPIDITDTPDLAPILFALCAYFGEGYFTGTRRLKLKESDRSEAMKSELAKLGAAVEIFENSVKIKCERLISPSEVIASHNDHRIVMALATLLTVTGGEIEGAEAISKSFPDYFERLQGLNVSLEKK